MELVTVSPSVKWSTDHEVGGADQAMLLTRTTVLCAWTRTNGPLTGSPPSRVSLMSSGEGSAVSAKRRHCCPLIVGTSKSRSADSELKTMCSYGAATESPVRVSARTREFGSPNPGSPSRQPCQDTSGKPWWL